MSGAARPEGLGNLGGHVVRLVLGLGAGLLWGACEPIYMYAKCGETLDCHSQLQDIRGTVCKNERCVCLNPDEDYCCRDNSGDCIGGDYICGRKDQCAALASGGTGGMSSATGVGGSGGAGVVDAECQVASDCPQPGDARCGTATCKAGVCGLNARPFGELTSQIRGDCVQVYCDGSGNAADTRDGGDVYNDGKQCTIDVCEDGKPTAVPFPDGSPCPESGGGVCFKGECVECVDNSAKNACIAGYLCQNGRCIPTGCVEPVIQCGKMICPPCLAGSGCSLDADCIDGVCGPSQICSVATCSDGLRNDSETGVDCGTLSCGPCSAGEGCAKPADCQSQVCWAAKCQSPACDDGVKNGDETDIDCGGSCEACP